jgi:hypothetical protein
LLLCRCRTFCPHPRGFPLWFAPFQAFSLFSSLCFARFFRAFPGVGASFAAVFRVILSPFLALALLLPLCSASFFRPSWRLRFFYRRVPRLTRGRTFFCFAKRK